MRASCRLRPHAYARRLPCCFFARLRRDDLRLGLIDSSKCLLNPRALKLALAAIVLKRSFGRLHGSIRLCHLGLKVVIL